MNTYTILLGDLSEKNEHDELTVVFFSEASFFEIIEAYHKSCNTLGYSLHKSKEHIYYLTNDGVIDPVLYKLLVKKGLPVIEFEMDDRKVSLDYYTAFICFFICLFTKDIKLIPLSINKIALNYADDNPLIFGSEFCHNSKQEKLKKLVVHNPLGLNLNDFSLDNIHVINRTPTAPL